MLYLHFGSSVVQNKLRSPYRWEIKGSNPGEVTARNWPWFEGSLSTTVALANRASL